MRTLQEVLSDGASFEPAEVARIGVELGRALQAAHASGLRFSRITAGHVLLADDGRVVLASSGREASPADDGSPRLNDALLYAAPETFHGEPGTDQGNVYSVGVLLYRLLTGAFPVPAQAVEEGRHAEAWTTRRDLRSEGSGVPLPLALIVERAIDPRPDARYATVGALSAALEAAAGELGAVGRARGGWFRYGAGLVALLAVAVIALVVAQTLEQPVVAVRFEYGGDSKEGAAIVDGMTIEMTRLLAEIQGLAVRSPVIPSANQSTMGDPAAFASQRRSNLVLSGVVRGQPGTWSHVEVSLLRGRNAAVLWTHSFPLADGDILDALARIADGIAGTLQLQFKPERRQYSTRHPLQELFLKGKALQAAGIDGRGEATELFKHVANADPDFVPAVAALVTTIGGVVSDSHDLPALTPDMKSARGAHAKAPHLAESNAAMGLLSAGLCQWNDGKAYFQKALEQNAAVTSTYIDYAIAVLLPLGDTQRALDVLTDALEADPRSIPVRRALAHVLVAHGDYDRAIETSRDVLQDVPQLEATEQTLARALYLKGRTDGARARLQGEGHWGFRGYIFAIEGRRSEARQLADANPDEPARQMLIYAGLKDVDRAVAALERAAEKHPWRALTWMARPEIEPVLRGDARAAALRERLHRPEGCAR